jgi:hypothetical protein
MSYPPRGPTAPMASRRRRRARLRATARPRPTLATSPTRHPPRPFGAQVTTTPSRRARRPAFKTSRYCLLLERVVKTDITGRAALGRQPASALGPAGLQDRPTGPGAHTGSEAMLALTTAGIGLKRALRHQLHLRSICPTGPRKIVVAKSWGPLRVPAQYRRRAFLHVKRTIAKEFPHRQTTLDAPVLSGPNMSRLRSRMRTGSVNFPPEEPVDEVARPVSSEMSTSVDKAVDRRCTSRAHGTPRCAVAARGPDNRRS